MMTDLAPPSEGAALENESAHGVRTLGWFVRRSALWLGVVAAGVILACLVYAAASDVESPASMPQMEVSQSKV
jgi:hypothetical protein